MTENFFETWLICNGWMNTGERYEGTHAVYRSYGGARIDTYDDGIILVVGPARVKFPYEGIHVDSIGLLWLGKEAFILPGQDTLVEEDEESSEEGGK